MLSPTPLPALPGAGDKDLDFSSYHSRYVALELLYLGGAYQGFAAQADSEETIEVRGGLTRGAEGIIGKGAGPVGGALITQSNRNEMVACQ